jgi:hypothetical protein
MDKRLCWLVRQSELNGQWDTAAERRRHARR